MSIMIKSSVVDPVFGQIQIQGSCDSKNPNPQSRALRLTEDVWHQKYGNKKEGF